MSAQPEVWRVSTIEGVFETDLETLKQWIVEGCVLPTDKVSKGSLNWIDAGRVPKLRAAFNGEIEPPPPPPQQTEASSGQAGWQTPPSFESQNSFEPSDVASPDFVPPVPQIGVTGNTCHNHPGVQPKYVCRICAAALCAACPRFVGSSSIPVCPLCGDLCKSYSEVTSSIARAEFQSSGFGISDFARAIRYPFQHKAALFTGALLYSFLMIAGFRGGLIAWMIMFGCISHVISQVAWGRLDRSFMPDFSGFSMWDDVIVPVFLGIGITIVSWGPVVVLTLALMFGVIASAPSSHDGAAVDPETAEQQQFSKALDDVMDPNADPTKAEEANRIVNEKLRPGSELAKEAAKSQAEHNDPTGMFSEMLPYLGAGAAILVLLLLGIGWAIFYYPMALAVAGYTQSFWSVVNPLVGLDTIRRMRSTYFKAFAMVLMVMVISFVVSAIIGLITSPLTLPFMGNLVANFINGSFTFYFNLVIACVLGLSLYKCADRLGITVD
jgi:hypothetical protein